jgi:hypothetical protein
MVELDAWTRVDAVVEVERMDVVEPRWSTPWSSVVVDEGMDAMVAAAGLLGPELGILMALDHDKISLKPNLISSFFFILYLTLYINSHKHVYFLVQPSRLIRTLHF